MGETPLQAIDRLRESLSIPFDAPITYAGRLDPMAEGVLILLSGDKVHEKDKYTKLDKVYKFQILFGFATDTFDILGRIQDTEDYIFNTPLFEKALKKFEGKQIQAYPPYSSKTVEGKPLFKWAREGRLHEIDIPTHEVEIKNISPVKVETISQLDLKEEIRERISLVKGDFRQKEILELWEAYIDNALETEFTLASVEVTCTSGTYIRALVDDIGRELGVPTTTYSINRVSIGEYTI